MVAMSLLWRGNEEGIDTSAKNKTPNKIIGKREMKTSEKW